MTLLTLLVAAAHLSLMILGIIGRLRYSVPSGHQFLEHTLANPIWVILHGLCFVMIVSAVSANKAQVPALGAATGVMGSWVFLSFLWGLSSPAEPSLASPVLGAVVTALAYVLTSEWAHIKRHRERTL